MTQTETPERGESFDHSDHTTDKEGYPVEERVTETLEKLDRHPCERVMCDYYKSGMIQYFSRKHYIKGETIELIYEETPYKVRTVETRTLTDGTKEGYMELVLPEDCRR